MLFFFQAEDGIRDVAVTGVQTCALPIFSQFCDSFSETYKDNFSYEGKRALFDYLEQISEDMGEDIELDPIALCCEYSEYSDADECAREYFEYEGSEERRVGKECRARWWPYQ